MQLEHPPYVCTRVQKLTDTFPVYAQGEEDLACGLYCLVSAAAALNTIDASHATGSATEQVWKRLPPDCSLFEKRPAVPSHLFDRGLWHCDLQTVGEACGLRAAKTDEMPRDISPSSPVLAYLALTSVRDPRGRHQPPFTHYVLALEYVPSDSDDTEGWMIIADPHPWRPLNSAPEMPRGQIYAVSTEQFLKAWRNDSEWQQLQRKQRPFSHSAWSLSALST
jgi:hypothetical protein